MKIAPSLANTSPDATGLPSLLSSEADLRSPSLGAAELPAESKDAEAAKPQSLTSFDDILVMFCLSQNLPPQPLPTPTSTVANNGVTQPPWLNAAPLAVLQSGPSVVAGVEPNDPASPAQTTTGSTTALGNDAKLVGQVPDTSEVSPHATTTLLDESEASQIISVDSPSLASIGTDTSKPPATPELPVDAAGLLSSSDGSAPKLRALVHEDLAATSGMSGIAAESTSKPPATPEWVQSSISHEAACSPSPCGLKDSSFSANDPGHKNDSGHKGLGYGNGDVPFRTAPELRAQDAARLPSCGGPAMCGNSGFASESAIPHELAEIFRRGSAPRPEASEEKPFRHRHATADGKPLAELVNPLGHAAEPAAQVPRPIDSHALAEQLSVAMQSRGDDVAAGQPIELRLRLDPPELGMVRVHLRLTDEAVSLRFIAGDEAVRRTLESQLPDLRQSLAERGLAFAQCDVMCDRRQQESSNFGRDAEQPPFAPVRLEPRAWSRPSFARHSVIAGADRVDVLA